MKRIGPAGARLEFHRVLRVDISVETPEDWNFAYTLEPPKVLPARRYDIRFELRQEVNDYPVRTFTVQMSCRWDGNDERAREELMASRQPVSRGISSECHLWDESDQPITIVVSDPFDIMPWLFPNMDLNEFFQQTQNQNAEPLRPVKELTGPSAKKLTRGSSSGGWK